jgi:hypothetical protein
MPSTPVYCDTPAFDRMLWVDHQTVFRMPAYIVMQVFSRTALLQTDVHVSPPPHPSPSLAGLPKSLCAQRYAVRILTEKLLQKAVALQYNLGIGMSCRLDPSHYHLLDEHILHCVSTESDERHAPTTWF